MYLGFDSFLYQDDKLSLICHAHPKVFCIVNDIILWFAAPEVVNYEPLGLEADMW